VRIAVTGRPGIGKTTLCLKVYNALKDVLNIEGFITLEVRERGRRIGFKLHDLSSGEELWLAKVGEGTPRVGKYVVFLDSIDVFAEKIENWQADLIILDEIGPMELKSRKFISAVENLLSRDNLLFTIHYKSKHPLVERIRRDFKVFVLDERNRDLNLKLIKEGYEVLRL